MVISKITARFLRFNFGLMHPYITHNAAIKQNTANGTFDICIDGKKTRTINNSSTDKIIRAYKSLFFIKW